MLKKASTVAAVVAGLMMLGSPAFALAGEPEEHGFEPWNSHGNYYSAGHVESYYLEHEDGDVADQYGLINFADDSDVLSNINLCEIEVNVIGIPVASQNDESVCINTDNDDNDGNGHSGGGYGGGYSQGD
ncbi:hypothetical protein [Saccharothrix syringae]|uniref:Uncharacterized protein n=1 Tax=Saccharothrix syringae TaxID=103733 RepID=A0A5Q0GRK8_SACSY|nr:hypothetical protein [Saccharothrix syringae]QFZ16697.1 hypothetical protein EKG83_03780 [Saccharothrix syringae]